MSSHPYQPEPLPDDELPGALVAALRSDSQRNVPAVPAAIDVEILREAKAGFARRRRFQLAIRGAAAVAAAAAVVAIALPLVQRAERPGGQSARAPVASKMLSVVPASEDVDRNGKVDILDAFVVAKLIETGKQVDEVYDVNGDGKVDQADVDRIANAAVAVAPSHPADERRMQ